MMERSTILLEEPRTSQTVMRIFYLPFADHLGRYAANNRKVRHVFNHDGSGRDNGSPTDFNPGLNNNPWSDKHIILNYNRTIKRLKINTINILLGIIN